MNKIKNLNLIISALAITGVSVNSATTSLANNGGLFTKNTTNSNKYNIDWVQKVGDKKEDKFYEIIPTKDKGYLAVGQASFTETTGFTSGDAIIVKYDKDGNEVWRDVLQGDETDRYYSVLELNDGRFIAFGTSYSTNLDFANDTRQGHAIAALYSKDGVRENVLGYKDGGKALVYKNAVLLSDGSILAVCGEIKANIGGDAIEKDSIVTHSLQKITLTTSRTLKRNEFKITDSTKNTVPTETVIGDIKNSSDGNILLTGYVYEQNNPDKISHFVKKMSESGKKVWETIDADCGPISSNSLIESKDGSIYVAGDFAALKDISNTDAMLIKFNGETGDVQWSTNITGENYDSFKSISINSKGDIIVVGHSNSQLANTTISNDKTEIIMGKFDKDNGNMLDIVNLGKDTQGIVAHSSFVDENDKVMIAGKQGFANGQNPCDLINPCVQYDAVLLSVTENLKNTIDNNNNTDCTVKQPVTLTKEEITLNLGDRFNIFDYIKVDNSFDIADIEIITDLSKDDKGYYAENAGTYYVYINFKDDCGKNYSLKFQAIFKDPSCPINPPTITAKDEHTYYIGDNLDLLTLITYTGINTDKVKDTSTEVVDGQTISTIEYISGDKIIISSDVDFKKEGTYNIKYTLVNKCGETSKTVKLHVKAKTTGDNNSGTTDKPQTGDNALVYVGLAAASLVGLVALNSKKNVKENLGEINSDDKSENE